MEFLNFGVEVVKRGTERARQGIVHRQECSPVRPENTQIDLGVEEGDSEPVAGGAVAVRLGNAMNQPFETQAPQVVGHLRGGVRTTEQGFDVRAEVTIAESAGQMAKGAERLAQCHDTGVAKAQRGDALAVCDRGML